MADTIVAKSEGGSFPLHPDGQFVGQCVDVIDLGDRVEEFSGQPKRLAHKCVLVFRTGEKDPEAKEYIDVSREFTVSMSEKANLRKFLEQWRGKPYTAAQIDDGVPIHKLEKQQGLLTVAHKPSAKGNVYAQISACVGVPKQMAAGVPTYTDYQRADFWAERRKEYAAGAAQFNAETAPARSASAVPGPNGFEDDGSHGDDDLPF